jgi:opacity protein-like surface antigen
MRQLNIGFLARRVCVTAAVLATCVASAFAQAAPAPAAAPTPPGDYFGWTAAGFIGSYFDTGGQAGAEKANASLTYGGEVGKFWGHVGAEFLADFAPSYKANTLFLSEHPEVNSYMGNVIGIWSTRFQNYFQPYGSGGVGAIQMHTSVLAAAARTDNVSNANVKIWSSRFGWNAGGGLFAFAGRAVGLRADVRYYSATNSSDATTENTPALRITEELTSGISFWRANIGVAFRW